MDLKNRFLSLGMDEAIVLKILPVISHEEAHNLYDLSDDSLRKKVPELLERVVETKPGEELDLSNIGLTNLGDNSTEEKVRPLPPPIPKKADSPINMAQSEDENTKPGKAFSLIGAVLLTIGLILLLNQLKESEPSSEKKDDTVKIENGIQKVQNEAIQPPKLIPVELTPEKKVPPAYRGSWMFMPWTDFRPERMCKDGRFQLISDKYTIQFWIKLTSRIPTAVSIVELFANNKPAESIFLNEDGLICFNPGNQYPNLVLMKRIPDSGRHFHIAAVRDGNTCRLYVNGKLRKESFIEFEEHAQRDFLLLFRSKSTLKGLAIDELMISNEVLFYKNFEPERILTMADSTVLYIPFEKGLDGRLNCYGVNHYSEFTPNGGKWLNVQNEVQQVINHIEFLDDPKDLKSSSSEP